MAIEIALERPDTPDATGLIHELEAHLAPRYPAASRHGYSVDRLLAEGVDFYVLRADGAPAACGGVLVVEGVDAGGGATSGYAEVKRMYVRPAFRGAGYGKAILDRLAERAREAPRRGPSPRDRDPPGRGDRPVLRPARRIEHSGDTWTIR